jgi:hypothetical protein
MNTSHEPATRINPDAEREKTPLDPPLEGATVPSGCAVVDIGLLKRPLTSGIQTRQETNVKFSSRR